MKHLIFLILLIVGFSCAQDDVDLDKFTNNRVEFSKQQVSLDSGSFSLMIPDTWDWRNEEEDCDGEIVLVLLNAGPPADKDGFIDLISIQKIKSQSNSNDLNSEFRHFIELNKSQSKFKTLVASGKTDILSYPGYYIYSKSDSGNYGESATISFIIESEDKGYFYHLVAGASQTDDFKKNMSIMIQSLQTFTIK